MAPVRSASGHSPGPTPMTPEDPARGRGHPVDRLPGGEGLATAVRLATLQAELRELEARLHAEIEQAFGLRRGQWRALEAVLEGAATPEEVAARAGEHPDAAAATLRTLRREGFVTGGAGDLQPTELGRARHDQMAASQLRLVADLPTELSDCMLASAQSLVGLAAQMRTAGLRAPSMVG